MNIAISVKNLSKKYKNVQALNDVNVEIPAGQITGLVGPNGAGKSTLIKALVGALNPNQGEIKVLESDPIKHRWELRKKLGYMPQDPALYEDLTTRENVAFYARLHKIKNPKEHAEKILKELDLGDRLKSTNHTLSGGMKKRVSLACTMVHDPKLLILDEPTAALDPLLKRNLWARFRKLADQGKTLIISTHLMDEAMLCDQVILMQKGHVIAQDTPRNLIARGDSNLHFTSPEKKWTETVSAEGMAMADALRKHGLTKNITKLEIDAENLEDVMIDLLNKQKK